MLKAVERQALQHPITPALQREFQQNDYEHQHQFCLLVYAISSGIWFLFDLIVSFQGGQGFTPLSVLFLLLLYGHLAALQVVRQANRFQWLNLSFVFIYVLGLRLIIAGLPVILQPVWLTLTASAMLYCASLMPLRTWSFVGVVALVWALLSPMTNPAPVGPFRLTLLISYWLFFTGLTCYSYRHNLLAKQTNYVMATLLLEQAYVDALTEIPNRRAFMTSVERLMQEPGEQRRYLAMIDIDDFKKVNDRFGHDIGDEVLKHVAKQIARVMATHQFARLGGEEFGIFLQGLSRLEAEQSVAELCRQVHDSPCEPPVTISIGLALIDRDGTLSQALIKADKALYESKHNGKNRFTYAA